MGFLLFLRQFRIRSTSHPIQDHTPVCLLLCCVHIFLTSRAYTGEAFFIWERLNRGISQLFLHQL